MSDSAFLKRRARESVEFYFSNKMNFDVSLLYLVVSEVSYLLAKFNCLNFSHLVVRIFRGFIARQYLKDLKTSNFERQRKAAVTLQRYIRH